MIVLITGPVRSGKSARAAHLARGSALPVTFIVTARADPADPEMNDRIARHRADRPAGATLIELWRPGAPDLPELLRRAPVSTAIVVDSLGTWVAGHLLDLEAECERDAVAAAAMLASVCEPLFAALLLTQARVFVVAEETGWGLVPVSAQGRIFRDTLGRLVARIAHGAVRTELVVAGFAVDLSLIGVRVDA